MNSGQGEDLKEMKANKGSQKIGVLILNSLIMISLYSPITVVWAEGGGQRPSEDYGINRRVRSEQNYVEVSGQFDVTFELRRNAAGQIDTRSFPSFYLGGRGVGQDGNAHEVDAGLQYDPRPPGGALPRWTLFIANQGDHTNPRVWVSGSGWHIPNPNGDSYTLHYKTEADGKLSLDVSGIGTFYWVDPNTHSPKSIPPRGSNVIWPWQSIGEIVMNPANFNTHSVKRVIALTQDKPQAGESKEGVLDGSTMTCVFSNGTVYGPARTQISWGQSQTDQGHPTYGGTGYDAPETGNLAYDAIWNSHLTSRSQFKVKFPYVTPQMLARGDFSGSHSGKEANVSRYQHETVNLNLRTVNVPRGIYRLR
jgi:hypothetical protein